MRYSQLFIPTLREVPAEAEIESHKLMIRAGLIRRFASGIYNFLPLGYRVFRKIETIIREEMENQGGQELHMSALIPAEVLQESGRWDVFGPEMFKLRDRGGREFCLGPTHEESFTVSVRNQIRSYKQLPQILYQIQTKFRDEIRPRFGVMRSREFVMKDAYSFDKDTAGLDISYQKMHDAYCTIFDRCGLDYTVVQADSGAMGGSGSEEFMVKSNVGEAAIAYCDACGYAANDEKAQCLEPEVNLVPSGKAMEKVNTPNVGTIDDLCKFFKCDSSLFAKTLIYKADDQVIAAVIRGDREINETKLQNLLGCVDFEMADPETIKRVTGADVGFAGPVELKIRTIADLEVKHMVDFITGANVTDYHLSSVNIDKTCIKEYADIRNIVIGDECPVCKEPIKMDRGIEVGHIFKLGTKYTDALGCKFLNENGKEKPMIMGSYGIGVARTMAAVIEQNCDDRGIVWPLGVAPYQVIVIPVNTAKEEQVELGEQIYKELKARGVDVLIDDRKERAGVKFNDADLIGIPIRITVGKLAGEGIVEYKLRKDADRIDVPISDVIEKVMKDLKL
ncbi:MAG: proline--tRNA ligase [Clostridiales bacterium]|nr:proline--tRNA ligase [Clostridiales bacterium]